MNVSHKEHCKAKSKQIKKAVPGQPPAPVPATPPGQPHEVQRWRQLALADPHARFEKFTGHPLQHDDYEAPAEHCSNCGQHADLEGLQRLGYSDDPDADLCPTCSGKAIELGGGDIEAGARHLWRQSLGKSEARPCKWRLGERRCKRMITNADGYCHNHKDHWANKIKQRDDHAETLETAKSVLKAVADIAKGQLLKFPGNKAPAQDQGQAAPVIGRVGSVGSESASRYFAPGTSQRKTGGLQVPPSWDAGVKDAAAAGPRAQHGLEISGSKTLPPDEQGVADYLAATPHPCQKCGGDADFVLRGQSPLRLRTAIGNGAAKIFRERFPEHVIANDGKAWQAALKSLTTLIHARHAFKGTNQE